MFMNAQAGDRSQGKVKLSVEERFLTRFVAESQIKLTDERAGFISAAKVGLYGFEKSADGRTLKAKLESGVLAPASTEPPVMEGNIGDSERQQRLFLWRMGLNNPSPGQLTAASDVISSLETDFHGRVLLATLKSQGDFPKVMDMDKRY